MILFAPLLILSLSYPHFLVAIKIDFVFSCLVSNAEQRVSLIGIHILYIITNIAILCNICFNKELLTLRETLNTPELCRTRVRGESFNK